MVGGARPSSFFPPFPLASDGALLKPGETLVNIESKETSLAAEALDV